MADVLDCITRGVSAPYPERTAAYVRTKRKVHRTSAHFAALRALIRDFGGVDEVLDAIAQIHDKDLEDIAS